MEIRELRGNRSYHRMPPIIRGTRRGIHLRAVQAVRTPGTTAGATTAASASQPDHSSRLTTTTGAVTGAEYSVPMLTLVNVESASVNEMCGVVESGVSDVQIEALPVTEIEATESPPDTPAAAWDQNSINSLDFAFENGDDMSALHPPTDGLSSQYLLYICIQAGTYKRTWKGIVALPSLRRCSAAVLLDEATNQWTSSAGLLHSLAEAYDDTTYIYSPQTWAQFHEGDVEDMTPYGVLHIPSEEPCAYILPCPELATFCQAMGQSGSTPCIALFLKTTLPHTQNVGNDFPQSTSRWEIRDFDPRSYKWLRYWKMKGSTGKYGPGYQMFRIILIALKLRDRLGFRTMAPTTTVSIPGAGRGVTITLNDLWDQVADISGLKCGYKTFRECGSLVKGAKGVIKDLEQIRLQHGLLPEEEERYEILRLMIRNVPISSRTSLMDTSSIEYQVNEMSVRKFIEVVRNKQ